MSNMYTQSVTLGSVTTSTPFVVKPPASLGTFGPGYLPPGILCAVSSGAVLTYSIEVTGDDVNAVGYNAATGNWVPLSAAMTGQASNASDAIGAAVRAIRINVTSWTSGTVTFQFVQMVE